MITKIDSITFDAKPYNKKFKIKAIRTRDIGNCYEITFKGTKENIKKMLAFHNQSEGAVAK